MSDYGADDDYDDFADDWVFMEEDYIAADDLAEHAIPSPPWVPVDDDPLEEWDRFDYLNDLEYGSDGYDGDATTKFGQKRKRGAQVSHGVKKQKLEGGSAATASGRGLAGARRPPVLWRTHDEREAEPRVFEDTQKPYALLKDWRSRMEDGPEWAKQKVQGQEDGEGEQDWVSDTESAHHAEDEAAEDVESADGADGADGMELDPAVLMSVLQERLASAGGPLSGMDPQQMLQFVTRMMDNKDAGDDIAGELADSMLNQGVVDAGDEGEEEDEGDDAPSELLQWLSQQKRDPDSDAIESAATPKASDSQPPPTPPSSGANSSIRTDSLTSAKGKNEDASQQNRTLYTVSSTTQSRKRKMNDNTETDVPDVPPKRRATRSYELPTSSSQARAVPPAARTSRAAREKRM